MIIRRQLYLSGFRVAVAQGSFRHFAVANDHNICPSHRINGHDKFRESDDVKIKNLDEALHYIKELRAELNRKDAIIEGLIAKFGLADSRNTERHASASETVQQQLATAEEKKVVVCNGSELVSAIDAGHGEIYLNNAVGTESLTFDLGTSPVRLSVARVEIRLLKPEGEILTVKGSFILKKTGHLGIYGGTGRRIRVEAALRDKPVFDAGEKSTLHLEGVSVGGGRDGVYLCGQAVATVDTCRIENCVRGIFEMHRCQAIIIGTEFINNIFHTVLLNKKLEVCSDLNNVHLLGASSGVTPVRRRVASLVADRWKSTKIDADSTGLQLLIGGANSFRGGRGDVVTMYNPMSDEYLEVYSTGGQEVKEVKLDEEERTANLADPIFR